MIDLDAALPKCDPDAFNSIGWHKGSVGYLVDYVYLAKTKDIISMLEGCIALRVPAHAENVMTYCWIEWAERRNLKYCLDKKKLDIYYLDRYKKEIINLEGFGQKSYDNLILSIEKSKRTTLSRFIFSLGLRYVGENNSELLANYFQSKESFENLISSKNLSIIS